MVCLVLKVAEIPGLAPKCNACVTFQHSCTDRLTWTDSLKPNSYTYKHSDFYTKQTHDTTDGRLQHR